MRFYRYGYCLVCKRQRRLKKVVLNPRSKWYKTIIWLCDTCRERILSLKGEERQKEIMKYKLFLGGKHER